MTLTPHLTTKVTIWSPKYSSQYDNGEWSVLISRYKVHHATPNIIIVFTKAKHLLEQRYAVRRRDVEKCPIVTNGKIECYEVPMSMLESWETPAEVKRIAMEVFDA